jgi:hypothetical protein
LALHRGYGLVPDLRGRCSLTPGPRRTGRSVPRLVRGMGTRAPGDRGPSCGSFGTQPRDVRPSADAPGVMHTRPNVGPDPVGMIETALLLGVAVPIAFVIAFLVGAGLSLLLERRQAAMVDRQTARLAA